MCVKCARCGQTINGGAKDRVGGLFEFIGVTRPISHQRIGRDICVNCHAIFYEYDDVVTEWSILGDVEEALLHPMLDEEES